MPLKQAIAPLIILALCFTVLAGFIVPIEHANSQVAQGIKESELKMRAYMISISEQLGVTCNHCHDMKDFKSDKKRAFQVAKDHMRLVDLIYNEGFNKQIRVDCRMCHRGEPKPQYLPQDKDN